MRGSIVGFVVPLGTRLSVHSTTTFLARTVGVSTTATVATSPTALTALLPNAGADKLTDFTGAAIQFFNSERVTAALIAGASLSSLFSLAKLAKEVGVTPKVKDDYHQTLTWALTRLYHGLCLMSVLLSLNVVVISTLACSTLLLEKHNGMAYNAYEFLFRELRYEFITTQWSFLMGLLSFIVSIATRSLLEFDLIRKGRRKSGLFVVFSISALIAHLISYINSTLHQWPNLAVMSVDLCWTVIHKAVNRDEKRPLELLSLVFGAAAFIVSTRLLKFGNTQVESTKPNAVADEVLPVSDTA